MVSSSPAWPVSRSRCVGCVESCWLRARWENRCPFCRAWRDARQGHIKASLIPSCPISLISTCLASSTDSAPSTIKFSSMAPQVPSDTIENFSSHHRHTKLGYLFMREILLVWTKPHLHVSMAAYPDSTKINPDEPKRFVEKWITQSLNQSCLL